MHQPTCTSCGTTLTGRQTRYCSQLCWSRGYNADRKADGRLKAQRQATRTERAAWLAANRHRYQYRETRICAQCGATFTARRHDSTRFCSRACVPPTSSPPTRRTIARRKMRSAARTKTDKRVFTEGPCHRCGTRFTAICRSHLPACYCSRQCLRADERARRRARQAGVKITRGRRIKVFERDDWTCRICGDSVNRNAKVPDLDAPTIDHIVPLAAGGVHGPANWQTAHFYCNSVKRDTDLCLTA